MGGARRGGAPPPCSAPVPLPKTQCCWGADPKSGVNVTAAVLVAPWHLGAHPPSVAPVTTPHLLLPQPWVPPDPAEGPKATARPLSITVASRHEGSVGGGAVLPPPPRPRCCSSPLVSTPEQGDKTPSVCWGGCSPELVEPQPHPAHP